MFLVATPYANPAKRGVLLSVGEQLFGVLKAVGIGRARIHARLTSTSFSRYTLSKE